MTTTITVCDTCAYAPEQKLHGGRTGGEMLAALLESMAGPGVEVRRHSCLMGCARHCNVTIQARGKLSYVLGGFAPESAAAEAIMAYARAYGESATGQVPYKQWPAGVKGHFVARIPPLPMA